MFGMELRSVKYSAEDGCVNKCGFEGGGLWGVLM